MRVVNCGVGVVSLFFVFFLSRCFRLARFRSAGRSFSVSCFSPAASHQLLFEQSESIRTPMMSCLTSGSRLGRNAPHLSDDRAVAGPAPASSSVPPCGQTNFAWKLRFVKVEG